MMGQSPRHDIPSFVGFVQPVPEKKSFFFFLRFLPTYNPGGHHGHVTWTIDTNIVLFFPKKAPDKIWL